MSDVDLTMLRKQFPADVIGKLPKITCRDCSKGSCGSHQRAKCGTCGNYISTAHIHIDYVGHADVTDRLLDVDPEWTWAPKATDPDPELLKAALASGNAELVDKVIANAPPRFERNERGLPVGFWITLTVGGVTRPGVGSVPATQMDAEKVLIGDALRNAAMRFGVALEQWQKGDRADPVAENSIGSAESDPRARAPQQPRGKVGRPADKAAAASRPEIPPNWQTVIDGMVNSEDADRAMASLIKAVRADKTVPPAVGNVIREAILVKGAALPRVEAVA